MSTYTLGDAARILKVSPARLRYWERTDLVQAQSVEGERALFEFRDLVCVRGILSLLEQGVPLRRIRRNVEMLRDRLPELEDPLSSLRVWVEGSERVVIRHEGVLFEPDGQMVLDFGAGVSGDEEVTPIAAAESSKDDREQTAEEYFERGCRLDTDPATFGAAIDAYLRGIELVPDFADCHCNLGAVYYNRGDRGAARHCFERCLEIDDRHVEGHFNLANLLEEDGCDEMALDHFRAAMAADPLYPDLHVNLALLYEKLDRGWQAGRHWRRYLQLDAKGSWSDVARRRLEREDRP